MIRNMKDKLLAWIERISGHINKWAWSKRYKQLKKRARDPNEWIKGYREWKKRCPHN
jgi:hypothetical protein